MNGTDGISADLLATVAPVLDALAATAQRTANNHAGMMAMAITPEGRERMQTHVRDIDEWLRVMRRVDANLSALRKAMAKTLRKTGGSVLV